MKKFLSCMVASAIGLSSLGTVFAEALPRDIDVDLDIKVSDTSGNYGDSLTVKGKSTSLYAKASIDMSGVKTAWNSYIERGVTYLSGSYSDEEAAKAFILNNVPLTGNFTLKVKGDSGLTLDAPEYSQITWSTDASTLFEAKNSPAITYNSTDNEYTLEMTIKQGVTNSQLDEYFNNASGLGDMWLTTSCTANSAAYATYTITAEFDGEITGDDSTTNFLKDMTVNFSGEDTASVRFRSGGGGGVVSTPATKPTVAPSATPEPTETPEPQMGGTANGAKLNYTDRIAYINGYDEEDGTAVVKPEQPITRAEVATIFFRLLDGESREKFLSNTNSFVDVADDLWYNEGISTVAAAGIIEGYEDGSFRPDRKITRAEFATIAARFTSLKYNGSVMFTDLDGHWATEYVHDAAITGWINGYEDGSFRPDSEITRAEAIAIINRMLYKDVTVGRDTDENYWVDNTNDKWYYNYIQEATNTKTTEAE